MVQAGITHALRTIGLNLAPKQMGVGVVIGVVVQASTTPSETQNSNLSSWTCLVYWFLFLCLRSRGHMMAAAAPELMSISKEGRE